MDEYESALAVTRAWDRTKKARRQALAWKAKAMHARHAIHAAQAALRAADALVAAAQALPDVVKTKALQQALSAYRKTRE